MRLDEPVEFTGVVAEAPSGRMLPTIMTSLLLVTLINSEGMAVTLETVFLVNITSSRYLPANNEAFRPATLLSVIIRLPPRLVDVAFKKSNT